jgi:hypothetical protein
MDVDECVPYAKVQKMELVLIVCGLSWSVKKENIRYLSLPVTTIPKIVKTEIYKFHSFVNNPVLSLR